MSSGGSNRVTLLAYVLIALGALLLAARLGWLDMTRVLGVLRFWPILVIAAGVDMLTGGKRRPLAYGAGIIAMFALFIAGVGASFGGLVGASARTLEVAQEFQGATSADVRIVTSLARLDLASSARSALLATGTLGQSAGEQVTVSYAVSGTRGRFGAVSSNLGPRLLTFQRAETWNLTLSGRVPLALAVETGVGESSLDLRELQLESLSIRAGVGRTTLHLPGTGAFPATIDGGVGKIHVRVPRELAIRIVVNTGLGDVNAASHFTRTGNVITSPSYSPSSPAVELQIDGGIGSIRIDTAD